MSYLQPASRFGRREPAVSTADAWPLDPSENPRPVKAPELKVVALPKAPSSAIIALRTLCLTRLEPAAIAGMPSDQLIDDIERLISEIATERRMSLNAREQRELAQDLVNDITGLGPLEPLLADDTINDIMVNGPQRIFVERRGKVFLSNARFRDTAHLINVCQRIAAGVGRRIDESSPMVDARLKDGSRVNIVFPPLALDGPYVSIRKFGKKVMDFAQLVEFGALTPQVANILGIASRARLNIIISGGTGSGKTTLMNALSQLIDVGERVVTVEDAAELQLQQPHVVRLETRPPNVEGKGEIAQRELVKNCLRMRPDRVIIGECRSGEALDMLQAMNTGHEGSMTTIHANTPRDALSRLEVMIAMAGFDIPTRGLRSQVSSALQIIVQAQRLSGGKRKVTKVSEITGMEGEHITMQDLFAYEQTGVDSNGQAVGQFICTGIRPKCGERIESRGMRFPGDLFMRRVMTAK